MSMKPYWNRDDITLYHADAVEAISAVGLESGADMILTSPPYGDLREYGGDSFGWREMLTACADALVEGGILVWVIQNTYENGRMRLEAQHQAIYAVEWLWLDFIDEMIWETTNSQGFSQRRYPQAFHKLLVFSKGAPKTTNLLRDKPNVSKGRVYWSSTSKGRKNDRRVNYGHKTWIVNDYGLRSNVWKFAVGMGTSAPDFRKAHHHPAVMPLALAKDLILTWSAPGELVLDPMAGSGTTLRAAIDLERRAIGIEVHQPYCDLIVERMRQTSMPLGIKEEKPHE